MWGEGATSCGARPTEDSVGRAARTHPLCSSSRFPRLAAGIPAHEAVVGDEKGDALEELAVFLGRVVDGELGDAFTLPGDGDRRRRGRRVRGACMWAEHERVSLDEVDAGPRVAGV